MENQDFLNENNLKINMEQNNQSIKEQCGD